MTKQEKGILEATKEFAEIHDIPYDDRIESMILNAMREVVKNCSISDVVRQSEQLPESDIDASSSYEFYIFEGNSLKVDRYIPIMQEDGWELAGEVAAKFGDNSPRIIIPLKRKI